MLINNNWCWLLRIQSKLYNRCDWASDGSRSKFFPSAVSKPSCSFLAKIQQQTDRAGREEGRARELVRKRDSEGPKLHVGWRFYLHLQPLSHKYPGRHSSHLAPLAPFLHLQYPVPLQRTFSEPKGSQLQSVETRHTHTHSGETGSALFNLTNIVSVFSTHTALVPRNGPLLPPSCTLLVYKRQIYNQHRWIFTSRLPFQRNEMRSFSWGRWVRVEMRQWYLLHGYCECSTSWKGHNVKA